MSNKGCERARFWTESPLVRNVNRIHSKVARGDNIDVINIGNLFCGHPQNYIEFVSVKWDI